MDQQLCSTHTDEELVQQALADQEYFGCLIARYENRLLSYITRLTNVNHQEAEDILQDTFIKAYYNLNDFDPKLKFSSWIYRIAHNETINTFRKNKARPQGNSFDVDDDVLERFIADVDLPKEVDRTILKKVVIQTFSEMDLKYKEVLVLKYYQEKSYKEISDIIKKPEGTVATLLNRARKQCRKLLQKQQLDFQ